MSPHDSICQGCLNCANKTHLFMRNRSLIIKTPNNTNGELYNGPDNSRVLYLSDIVKKTDPINWSLFIATIITLCGRLLLADHVGPFQYQK
jgi:hypothetical protein